MHFMNIGHTYQNAARFVQAMTGKAPTLEELPSSYRAAISAPELRPMPITHEGLNISYEDGTWARYCAENGVFPHIFRGAGPTDGPTREAWDSNILDALSLIRRINPDLRTMVDFMVSDVVVLNSGTDGGGSASQLPGLVVMSPGATWTTLDYAMCLVHEGLHLNLFLGDAVHRTFYLTSVELEADEHRALSAVKIGQRRPLDKAFHAAAVTVPLMYMEDHQGETTLVDLYTASLKDACADLRKQREKFTPYGRLLLDELTAWGENIDFPHAARTISEPGYASYAPARAAA
ncbi:aKG-HExxH-type peptide beta-hydroxylase [Streptomyces sp. H27-H5]|uniref:aKG-HExxH-type peptide beta-hydroxylase n=1 Tax=Streptomyces sp. H27-H5 TaxID=2996460 RepID=UPI00226F9F67|nr:HEXXH motif-containing putative peptide modification protein [Streptomyces sp. H27-H5]MCY0955832.1 HEXXH motif-containing putative peptide modification protein [Streptomyces sp. H27-H5]